MGIIDLLILILVAAICGALGQALAGYTRGGCMASAAIGFVGALLGNWASRRFGLPDIAILNIGGQPFPIVWSILGSALFVALLGLLTTRRS
jgi:uncharacterized membrane protein YeaQ/YmgE (transglycosylase-associated protein family)